MFYILIGVGGILWAVLRRSPRGVLRGPTRRSCFLHVLIQPAPSVLNIARKSVESL